MKAEPNFFSPLSVLVCTSSKVVVQLFYLLYNTEQPFHTCRFYSSAKSAVQSPGRGSSDPESLSIFLELQLLVGSCNVKFSSHFLYTRFTLIYLLFIHTQRNLSNFSFEFFVCVMQFSTK